MKFGTALILACAMALDIDSATAGNLKQSKESRMLLKRKLGDAVLTGGANPKVTFQPGCFDWGKHIRE